MGNIADKLIINDMTNLLNATKENVSKNLSVSDVCVVQSVISMDDVKESESEIESPISGIESTGWIERTSIIGLKYGEEDASYYWDPSVNPNATFNYCLPNCTTYSYGRVLEAGCDAPISEMHNAKNWHNYLTNGWESLSYEESQVGIGDILEWDIGSAGHVAVVENIDPIMISASDYTDDSCGWPLSGHRTPNVYWGGSPYKISSMKNISDWLSMKAPNRFFRCWSLSNEIKRAGAKPKYILKNPGGFYDNSKKRFYCKSLTSGITTLCYCGNGLKVAQGSLVVVVYTDSDFRPNLVKYKNNEELVFNKKYGLHDKSYGIIVARM